MAKCNQLRLLPFKGLIRFMQKRSSEKQEFIDILYVGIQKTVHIIKR